MPKVNPVIGKGESGDMALDVARLVETRLLVQANSGAGKSWALRRVLERTFGQIPHLVIDSEGEFATLREKFDYIICAPHDADAVATPRTAGLLARRLLETRASAIIDIYDLKAHERTRFVRLFLEALINAPKKLYGTALVVIDEAHVFCPQTGQAESAGAVIDLATRGRKRGFCAVLATQRLSKLHKDAAAETLNKLIGRTGLDVDMKRAADELGFAGKDAALSLRRLKPGEFFAFGPALSDEVVTLKVGPVATSHPKSGQRMMAEPPAPTAKVKKILAELSDLETQAEAEAKTTADLKREIAELKRKLTIAEKQVGAGGVPEAEIKRRVAVAVKDALNTRDGEWAIRLTGAKVDADQKAKARIERELVKVSAALHRALGICASDTVVSAGGTAPPLAKRNPELAAPRPISPLQVEDKGEVHPAVWPIPEGIEGLRECAPCGIEVTEKTLP